MEYQKHLDQVDIVAFYQSQAMGRNYLKQLNKILNLLNKKDEKLFREAVKILKKGGIDVNLP